MIRRISQWLNTPQADDEDGSVFVIALILFVAVMV